MNPEAPPSRAAARWIDAWVRVFDPAPETCLETELLKHFPFARVAPPSATRPTLRVPATAHGTR